LYVTLKISVLSVHELRTVDHIIDIA